MTRSSKVAVRTSVSLPSNIARQVKKLASTRTISANRVLVELIEEGLRARERERARFMDLADRLACAPDADEQGRIKRELALMTFGE